MKNVSILIPIFNALEHTKKCLKNLSEGLPANNQQVSYSIIVSDDNSTDGSKEWINNNYPDIIVLEGTGDLWWSGGINLAAKYAIDVLLSDYLLLWNNDIQTASEYFPRLTEVIMDSDDNCITGSKIVDVLTKKVWSVGGKFNPINGDFYMVGYNTKKNSTPVKEFEIDWLPGMGTLVPAKIVKTIGYWDDKRFPQYFGDTEFTYRAGINGFRLKVSNDLIIYNDTTNTGNRHDGQWSRLFWLLTDKKSLYNFRVVWAFYRLYAKSILAYKYLFKMYFYLFGGFIKWKLFSYFRTRN